MTTNNSLNRRSDKFTITPSGTGAGETGELRFKELEANGENHVSFKAPDDLSVDQTYTLPTGYPASNGQVLASQTDGTLSWASSGGGGGGGDGSYELIDTVTTSGLVTSIDFTGDWSDYKYLKVVMEDFHLAASGSGSNGFMRFSTDEGSTWVSATGAYAWSYVRIPHTGSPSPIYSGNDGSGSSSQFYHWKASLTTNASFPFAGIMTIQHNLPSSGRVNATMVADSHRLATTGESVTSGGTFLSSNFINGIRVYGSRDIAGTVHLYGFKG
jgi:hypothetical protein